MSFDILNQGWQRGWTEVFGGEEPHQGQNWGQLLEKFLQVSSDCLCSDIFSFSLALNGVCLDTVATAKLMNPMLVVIIWKLLDLWHSTHHLFLKLKGFH